MKGIVVIPNLRLSPLNHHSSQKGCINKIQICLTEIKIKGDYSPETHNILNAHSLNSVFFNDQTGWQVRICATDTLL